MRIIPAATAAAAALLIGGAALVQASSYPNPSTSPAAPGATQQRPQATAPQAGSGEMFTRQNVMQKLQAGLRNIDTIDAAFIVKAVDSDGKTVVMVVNAPDFRATASTAQPGQTPQPPSATQPGTTAPASIPAKLRQELTNAGFRDIELLQAGLLVRATTQDGGTVVALLNLDRPASMMPPTQPSSPSGPTSR